jgi:hypothetical protein
VPAALKVNWKDSLTDMTPLSKLPSSAVALWKPSTIVQRTVVPTSTVTSSELKALFTTAMSRMPPPADAAAAQSVRRDARTARWNMMDHGA